MALKTTQSLIHWAPDGPFPWE